jgi:formylmethanofuran dehydrogenase subunit C
VYNSSQGRTYIFYNNGVIITENASGADIIIIGEATSSAGDSMTAGDFNADGKTDLVIGGSEYNSNQGRAYIFITEVRDAIKKTFNFKSGTFKFKGDFKFNPGS